MKIPDGFPVNERGYWWVRRGSSEEWFVGEYEPEHGVEWMFSGDDCVHGWDDLSELGARIVATGKLEYVEFYGGPGYTYEGEVLGEVQWNGIRMLVVRYWAAPDFDPPRKPYTLVVASHCKPKEPTEGYIRAEF